MAGQGLSGALHSACPFLKPWCCARALATQRCGYPACWTKTRRPRLSSNQSAGCPCWSGGAILTHASSCLIFAPLCLDRWGRGFQVRVGGISPAGTSSGSSSLLTAVCLPVPGADRERKDCLVRVLLAERRSRGPGDRGHMGRGLSLVSTLGLDPQIKKSS